MYVAYYFPPIVMTHLLDMPPEILVMVGEYLSHDDLVALVPDHRMLLLELLQARVPTHEGGLSALRRRARLVAKPAARRHHRPSHRSHRVVALLVKRVRAVVTKVLPSSHGNPPTTREQPKCEMEVLICAACAAKLIKP